MKKIILAILLCCCLVGCGQAKPPETVQIGNPWILCATMDEAIEKAGCALPEQLAGYTALEYRVMNSQLLEVLYQDSDGYTVTVRKAPGEDRDISGDYTPYPHSFQENYVWGTVTHKTDEQAVLSLFYRDGCAYSLYAPQGYPGDTCSSLINALFEE